MDYIVYGVTKSRTRLTHFHFHFFTFKWDLQGVQLVISPNILFYTFFLPALTPILFQAFTLFHPSVCEWGERSCPLASNSETIWRSGTSTRNSLWHMMKFQQSEEFLFPKRLWFLARNSSFSSFVYCHNQIHSVDYENENNMLEMVKGKYRKKHRISVILSGR